MPPNIEFLIFPHCLLTLVRIEHEHEEEQEQEQENKHNIHVNLFDFTTSNEYSSIISHNRPETIIDVLKKCSDEMNINYQMFTTEKNDENYVLDILVLFDEDISFPKQYILPRVYEHNAQLTNLLRIEAPKKKNDGLDTTEMIVHVQKKRSFISFVSWTVTLPIRLLFYLRNGFNTFVPSNKKDNLLLLKEESEMIVKKEDDNLVLFKEEGEMIVKKEEDKISAFSLNIYQNLNYLLLENLSDLILWNWPIFDNSQFVCKDTKIVLTEKDKDEKTTKLRQLDEKKDVYPECYIIDENFNNEIDPIICEAWLKCSNSRNNENTFYIRNHDPRPIP